MARKIAPSEAKGPEIAPVLPGYHAASGGAELLRPLGRFSTARVLQEALEHAPTEALGRDRSERRAAACGYRHGDEAETVKAPKAYGTGSSRKSRGSENHSAPPCGLPWAGPMTGSRR